MSPASATTEFFETENKKMQNNNVIKIVAELQPSIKLLNYHRLISQRELYRKFTCTFPRDILIKIMNVNTSTIHFFISICNIYLTTVFKISKSYLYIKERVSIFHPFLVKF